MSVIALTRVLDCRRCEATGPAMNHPKYGNVDPECVELCDAINRQAGLETTYSCCGHGKQGFLVFVTPKHVDNLAPLMHMFKIANRWSPMSEWRIDLVCRGVGGGVCYMIHSASIGDAAFAESRSLAKLLDKQLEPAGTDREFDKKWNE